MHPCAVIFTGGRRFANAAFLYATLDRLRDRRNLVLVIHGACETGADRFAAMWTKSRQVPCEAYAADWEREGKSAGPHRNGLMVERIISLQRTHIVGVVAFEGGAGTADCCRRAAAEGIVVWRPGSG